MADWPPRFTGPLADRYRLESEIGRGGMATVYRARDLRHDRVVAIKILRPELASALGSDRFLQEIRIAARLSHPHILPLHDSGEVEGCPCYVMPCVDGESLRDRLTRQGALPLDEALDIGREVGEALGYAHEQGIVHRDIKPENILLAAGHALVADFGIARAIDAAGGARLTSTGIVLGTPAYMSPEQATGGSADARSDLYALACVLYEALAGEPPFAAPTAQMMLSRRLTDAAPSVRVSREAVPEHVDRAIRRALARNPADRFPTVAEFLQALHPPVAPSAPVAVPGPARRAVRGWRLGAALLVGAGVLALGAVIRGRSSPPVAPTRLAIMPFTVRGDSGFEYLAEGIVDLLARSLDGAGGLRTVEPGTVLSALGMNPARTADQERYREVARRVGAGAYVLGSAHAVGGRLRIQAGIYDDTAGEPGAARSQVEVEGDAADVLGLVDQLAARVMIERGDAPGRLVQTAALTTQSLPALKTFLAAEQALRSGPEGIDSAIAGFQRAVAEDSTFALAYYRLAVAAGWQLRHEVATAATAAALRHSSRLAERDRRLLEAYGHYRRGEIDAAEDGFRGLVRDYPDDLEATFQLADLQFHWNPLRGRSQAEARDLFDRVLSYDPGFL